MSRVRGEVQGRARAAPARLLQSLKARLSCGHDGEFGHGEQSIQRHQREDCRNVDPRKCCQRLHNVTALLAGLFPFHTKALNLRFIRMWYEPVCRDVSYTLPPGIRGAKQGKKG